jgi:hypothetical protein
VSLLNPLLLLLQDSGTKKCLAWCMQTTKKTENRARLNRQQAQHASLALSTSFFYHHLVRANLPPGSSCEIFTLAPMAQKPPTMPPRTKTPLTDKRSTPSAHKRWPAWFPDSSTPLPTSRPSSLPRLGECFPETPLATGSTVWPVTDAHGLLVMAIFGAPRQGAQGGFSRRTESSLGALTGSARPRCHRHRTGQPIHLRSHGRRPTVRSMPHLHRQRCGPCRRAYVVRLRPASTCG